jgi:hypothetical protein
MGRLRRDGQVLFVKLNPDRTGLTYFHLTG